MSQACEHLTVQPASPNTPEGCEDCLAIGARWVQLRLCLECGHVGCCDSSPNRHATAHHDSSGHPAIRSFQPGERWGYCYEHDLFLEAV